MSGWLFWSSLFYFFVVVFPLMSENNKEIYAQVCKWLAATRSRCNGCLIMNEEPMWTKHLESKKKKSILFVLPDILMFNMRVLYYHEDYDYTCAILVYCCLNVTLFFYDMLKWKPWAWEWWQSFNKKIKLNKIKSETRRSHLYTESECRRWLANF